MGVLRMLRGREKGWCGRAVGFSLLSLVDMGFGGKCFGVWVGKLCFLVFVSFFDSVSGELMDQPFGHR